MPSLFNSTIILLLIAVSSCTPNSELEFHLQQTNALLMPLSNLQTNETNLANQIIGSLYGPFGIQNPNNSEDAVKSLQKHLDFEHFKQFLPSLPDNYQELMQLTIDESLDLESLQTFKSPLDIDALHMSLFHSLKNLTTSIINTLNVDLANSLHHEEITKTEYVSYEISQLFLDESINNIKERILQISKDFKIEAKTLSDYFNQQLTQKLVLFNSEFVDQIVQIVHLMQNPTRFLKSQYILLFTQSVILPNNNAQNRLEFIISLISSFADSTNQIKQIFAFLFNFIQENKMASLETILFAQKSINSLFQIHFRSEKTLSGQNLLKFINGQHITTSIWDISIINFLLKFHSLNFILDYSLFATMNYLLISERISLPEFEYTYVVNNLDKMWTVTSQNQIQLEFANKFLGNDLISLSNHGGFYIQTYSLLMEFLTQNLSQSDKLYQEFDVFLDQKLSSNKSFTTSDYFQIKVLNVAMSALSNSEFDFKFLYNQIETTFIDRIVFEVNKNLALENLMRKIYRNLNPILSDTILIENMVQFFLKTQFNSQDFKVSTVIQESHKAELALNVEIDKIFNLEVEYSKKNYLLKKPKLFNVSEIQTNIFNSDELPLEIKSRQAIEEQELDLHIIEQNLGVSNQLRENDAILNDIRESCEFK